MYGDHQDFLGWRASNRDITARKEAEEEMLRLRKELFHATRVITAGHLAASLAHELNQPLAWMVPSLEDRRSELGNEELGLS